MDPLTLTLIRLAFLLVLWLFVIAAVGVVRTDIFGTAPGKRANKRANKRARQPGRAGPAPGRPHGR